MHGLVDRALAELAAARAARRREARRRSLLARCDDIEAQVARVAPRIPALHAAYVEKLGARLQRGRPRPERGSAEAGARALREQDRRRRGSSRASRRTSPKCGRVLAQGGSAGKRLDFLAQELHREANTLGSKSVDAELSQASLELKVADRADARAGAEYRVAPA